MAGRAPMRGKGTATHNVAADGAPSGTLHSALALQWAPTPGDSNARAEPAGAAQPLRPPAPTCATMTSSRCLPDLMSDSLKEQWGESCIGRRAGEDCAAQRTKGRTQCSRPRRIRAGCSKRPCALVRGAHLRSARATQFLSLGSLGICSRIWPQAVRVSRRLVVISSEEVPRHMMNRAGVSSGRAPRSGARVASVRRSLAVSATVRIVFFRYPKGDCAPGQLRTKAQAPRTATCWMSE